MHNTFLENHPDEKVHLFGMILRRNLFLTRAHAVLNALFSFFGKVVTMKGHQQIKFI